jgi:hypothetical protein
MTDSYSAGIDSRIEVHLGWWDRVRVLFGASLTVFLETKIEREPGRVISSQSSLQVGRPRNRTWLLGKPIDVQEATK